METLNDEEKPILIVFSHKKYLNSETALLKLLLHIFVPSSLENFPIFKENFLNVLAKLESEAEQLARKKQNIRSLAW